MWVLHATCISDFPSEGSMFDPTVPRKIQKWPKESFFSKHLFEKEKHTEHVGKKNSRHRHTIGFTGLFWLRITNQNQTQVSDDFWKSHSGTTLKNRRPVPIDAPWKISIEDGVKASYMLDEWPFHKNTLKFRRDFRFSRVRIFEIRDFLRFDQCILYSCSRWCSLWQRWFFRTKPRTIYDIINVW